MGRARQRGSHPLSALLSDNSDSWRRQRNSALRFPDFLAQKLGGTVVPGKPTASCKYFETRLFSTLPWLRCTNADSFVGARAERVVTCFALIERGLRYRYEGLRFLDFLEALDKLMKVRCT